MENKMEIYKLEFYVPETHAEKVKKAIFAAGGGKLGNYDCCCWQTIGTGQFKALDGSEPFIGEQNQVEMEPEYKVEMVVPEEKISAVIEALKETHPYETPAFQYWKVITEIMQSEEDESEENDNQSATGTTNA